MALVLVFCKSKMVEAWTDASGSKSAVIYLCRLQLTSSIQSSLETMPLNDLIMLSTISPALKIDAILKSVLDLSIVSEEDMTNLVDNTVVDVFDDILVC
jgi:hypothetical protein